MNRRAWTAMIFGAAILSSVAKGEDRELPDFGMSLTIPDGAVSCGQDRDRLCFRITEEARPVELRVLRLSGTIGRNRLSEERLKRHGDSASTTDVEWTSFALQRVRNLSRVGDVDLVAYRVQVPLTPQAVQIEVVGLAQDEKRIDAISRDVVKSVRGSTSWLSDEERSERLGFISGAVVGVAVIGVLGWLLMRRFARTKAR